MFPFACDLATMVFLVGVKRLVGERPANLIRRLDSEFVLPIPNLRLHVGEAVRELLNSVSAVSQTHRLLDCLAAIVREIRRVSSTFITMEDAIIDESFEDTFSRLM